MRSFRPFLFFSFVSFVSFVSLFCIIFYYILVLRAIHLNLYLSTLLEISSFLYYSYYSPEAVLLFDSYAFSTFLIG